MRDAPHRPGPDRRADRAARRSTISPTTTGELRFARSQRRTGRTQLEEHAPDDAPLLAGRRASPGIAELNPAARARWAVGERGPISSTAGASGARARALDGLGRKRGKLHRAQSPAARGERHLVHRRPSSTCRRRFCFVITPRRRHAASTRGAAARLVGTLAHPPNRPRLEPVREGRASSRATGSSSSRGSPRPLPTEREGASFLRRVSPSPARPGIDPYAAAGVGRVPGPVWRGSVAPARAGFYEVDARFERALSRGGVPRTRSSATTFFAGALRPGRARHRTSSSSKTPPARYERSRRRASTAGRAAAGSSLPVAGSAAAAGAVRRGRGSRRSADGKQYV